MVFLFLFSFSFPYVLLFPVVCRPRRSCVPCRFPFYTAFGCGSPDAPLALSTLYSLSTSSSSSLFSCDIFIILVSKKPSFQGSHTHTHSLSSLYSSSRSRGRRETQRHPSITPPPFVLFLLLLLLLCLLPAFCPALFLSLAL